MLTLERKEKRTELNRDRKQQLFDLKLEPEIGLRDAVSNWKQARNTLQNETQKLSAHELERGERRTSLRFGKLEEREKRIEAGQRNRNFQWTGNNGLNGSTTGTMSDCTKA